MRFVTSANIHIYIKKNIECSDWRVTKHVARDNNEDSPCMQKMSQISILSSDTNLAAPDARASKYGSSSTDRRTSSRRCGLDRSLFSVKIRLARIKSAMAVL
jgi:hypothetical protein